MTTPVAPPPTRRVRPALLLVAFLVVVFAVKVHVLPDIGYVKFSTSPWQWARHLLMPWIALGIALLIGFFASYLTALSWADLTFVLPATAFGNVIVALFARFWLHESISWQRWAGVILITVGVGFVAQGPAVTERPAPQPAEAVEEEPVR